MIVSDDGGYPVAGPAATEPPAKPVKKEPVKKTAPPKKRGGFCVYLGPSIHGVIVHGAVFPEDRAATLERIKEILTLHPLVASLIVSGESLATSRLQVKTPGNLLYINYNKLAGRK